MNACVCARVCGIVVCSARTFRTEHGCSNNAARHAYLREALDAVDEAHDHEEAQGHVQDEGEDEVGEDDEVEGGVLEDHVVRVRAHGDLVCA